MKEEVRKGLFVHLWNLAGEELCSVEVPENTKNCDLKGTISRQLGLYPYSFKLITLVSGATVEGGGLVSSISQNGRLDVTLVKIDGIPTPDSRGYLQLQPEWSECAAPSIKPDVRRGCSRFLLLWPLYSSSLMAPRLLLRSKSTSGLCSLPPRGAVSEPRSTGADRIMDYDEVTLPVVLSKCKHAITTRGGHEWQQSQTAASAL